MDKLIVITACEDGSCCCLPTRNTVASIAILSMVVCLVDLMTSNCWSPCCSMKYYVESMRVVLTWLFQIANVLLLTSSIFENALLAGIYVWYTLGYVVMGLCIAILELLLRVVHEGAPGLAGFATETAFFFVISRCLPLVNSYRQHLYDAAASPDRIYMMPVIVAPTDN